MSPNRYKPFPLATAPYPLTGGVDTKIHGLVVPAPKLQSCTNAFIEQTGSLRRRWGRSSLANTDASGNSITGWVATAGYDSRVQGFTSTKLYDYSSSISRWADAGRATGWRMRSREIDAGDISSSVVGGTKDVAIIGNYTCYAYEWYELSGTTWSTRVSMTLIDTTTGARLTTAQQLAIKSGAASPVATSVRVVAHGNLFYVIYWDPSTAATIKCFRVDTTSASTIASSLAGSATNLATNLSVYLGVYAPLDVVNDIWHGPFLVYRSTTANTLGSGIVNSSGSLVNTNNIATPADAVTVACDAISTGANTILIGVVASMGTITNDIYARLRSFNGTTWTSVQTSAAMDTTLPTAVTRGLACQFESTTLLRAYYDGDTYAGGGVYPCVMTGTYDTAGTITSNVSRINRSYLASKPFTGADGLNYVWVKNEEPAGKIVQPTLFLMKMDTGAVPTSSAGLLAAVANQGIAVQAGYQPYGITHVVSDVNGKSFSFFTDYYTSLGTDGTGAKGAFREVIIDMAHAESHVTVNDGDEMLVPSGVLQTYDGVSCTEVGFLQYTDNTNRTNLSQTGGGSLTLLQQYSYRIVPEWTNAKGHREQGTDSGPVSFTLTGGNNAINVRIDFIPWTLKSGYKNNLPKRQNLVWAIYRTTVASPTASSSHHRVGSLTNLFDTDRGTFLDTMSDAVAATQEELVIDVELDGVAPAPGYITCSGNGRVFLAGIPDDPNLILYSKLRDHSQGLVFNDVLQILIPKADGAITGMCVFAESLIVFTATAIYRVNGPGLSNQGSVGGFTDPVRLLTDTGCTGHRSIVVTPMGVMYESVKGKMMLTPSFTVQYVGAPLEKLADPGTCTGATLVPNLRQVRYSYSATTHVYDYYHGQWYVFTHHSDGPTSLWNNVLTAISGDLVVYDNSAVWQDGSTDYAVTLVLGWMHAASLAADLEVRKIALTGQYLDAAYTTIYVAQDQGSTSQTILKEQLTAGRLFYITRVKKQLCSQIEITIRDAQLDVYGQDVVHATAGWCLNELTFEMALRNPLLGRGGGG